MHCTPPIFFRWILPTVTACWICVLPANSAEIAKPTLDPAIYGHVVKVGWVVKDLDRVVDYWEKLGLRNVRRAGVREHPDVIYRGKKSPLRLKVALADIHGVEVEWIQPVKGRSDFDEFLKKHGDGIHHISFGVRNAAGLEQQIEYFKTRGVGVIQSATWQAANGQGRYAYLDTAARGGGLTIEIVFNPDGPPRGSEVLSTQEYPLNKITHYAFMVRDIKKVDAFYESLGFGGMSINHNISLNRNYRGAPGKFEMYLGWWRWGSVPIEWIERLAGPSIYDEYLDRRGEGFHHVGFQVNDMDEGIKLLDSRGAPVSQSGGWDNPGGKGRFAYLDTEPIGGVVAELIWVEPREK